MAMTRRRKICIALAVLLIAFFFILPLVLGVAMRGTVEKKISEVTKAPVKLGSLSVNLLPPGAVLGNLEVGEPVAELNGAPLAKIGSLKASVTWNTVFGGPKHITSLKIHDVSLALACDEKGSSNLQRFSEKMGPSDRKDPLPVDSIVVKNAKITCYVPPKLLAPESNVTPDVTTATAGYLRIDRAVFAPPGQRMAAERWMSIEAEDVRVTAPLNGIVAAAAAAEAGPPMDEGAFLKEASFELAMPAADDVLKVRKGSVHGLKVRNVLHAPNTPETLERMIVSLKAAAQGSAGLKSRKGDSKDTAPFYIDGLQVRDSALEICGPDVNGKPAFWRLSQVAIDVQKFPWGPGAETSPGEQGLLKIASPSKSTAGDGNLLVEWTGIQGKWPKLTFDTKEELKCLPLAPLSARVEERTGAGVEGSLDSTFAGPTRDGAINWDGAVTLSKDTKLVGKSMKGKMLSRLSSMTSDMSGLATGKPIEGFGVRGTLDNPKFKQPPIVSGAVIELAKQVMLEKSVSLPDVMFKGVGDVFGKGVGEGKDVLKKVPGLEDFLKK